MKLAYSLSINEYAAAAGTPRMLLPNIDVLIDVGHGGIDGGTSFGDVVEKTINLELAKRLYDTLNKKGIRTAMNRNRDYALSDDNHWAKASRHRRDLIQRKEIANGLMPKIMVSIHVNWSSDSKRSGPLVLYQNNQSSVLLGSFIQKSLNRLYVASEKPIHGRRFFLLNTCKPPTVIVETGYISNHADRARLTHAAGQKKVADTIASAIQEYFEFSKPYSGGVHLSAP